MKFHFILIATLALAGSSGLLRAEDWKTTDGKIYQDVKVIEQKPDAVTIMHRDGGGVIPLAKLPPDLQKRFGYDPAKAALATKARTEATTANGKALQAEMNFAARQRSVSAGIESEKAHQQASNSAPPSDADLTPDTPTGPIETPAGGPTISDADQSAANEDDGASVAESTPADTQPRATTETDATHLSMDSLTGSVKMRPDLSDPTYSTSAHLTYVINSQGLGPDPSDKSHHSMDEIANP